MNNISKHISYIEATHSDTAIRKGIKNIPSNEELENMKLLAEKIFEPVRSIINKPININSFYRSIALNKAVGGSATSEHCKGMAIDMSSNGLNKKIFDIIRGKFKFTQLIWEYGDNNDPKWIHVSYNPNNLKCQVLRTKVIKGKTFYEPYIQTL